MSVRQNSQNILILKDAVGKPKRTTRDLPSKIFSYGKEIPRDPVGVQNLTSEWIYEEKSLEAPIIYDKDFKKLNKIATASRVTTCIDQYKMRSQLVEKVRIKGPRDNDIKR